MYKEKSEINVLLQLNGTKRTPYKLHFVYTCIPSYLIQNQIGISVNCLYTRVCFSIKLKKGQK